MSDNGPQAVNRYKKADKVARYLQPLVDAKLITVPALEAGYDDSSIREHCARLAECHVPSEVTWALVIHLVQERSTA